MPRWLARPVGLFVELLAAVPSVIFGIWGVAVIVPFVHGLNPAHAGYSLLSAALVLAIMVLPIITAVTRDMLRAVPRSQREAALALGATPWEVTWRIILPNARSGIMAGSILALGRAIGETMAVILVIGYTPQILFDIFGGGATLAGAIANEFGEAQGIHRAALIELGLVMLVLSLALSIGARFIVRSFGRRMTV
jgi:phosphate transport system permease protein